ncbi:ankyrin repeat domain-containing protein [Actinoplanes palleronii]|uniref:Ankyrin repeat protein n=1 Tax=Actinoplanes palleronii TaxID=113570 RepID=A0ABQ4BRF5_9ACTN|nr:ankyrin repeat domain-containing protein [Actinoplanes palleronii]GIE73258.1 hypothetical protein Apa02nite_093660 [Actinoplanes palleronii]
MDLTRRRDRERYARQLTHATPAAMIMDATVAREAGDWRAACTAAGVDVHVDLRDVAARFGTAQASMIEADLAGFAPDFLRRHLPRADSAALEPGVRLVLSRRPEPFRTPGRLLRRRGTPVLVVTLPPTMDAPQRLALRVADVHELTGWWVDMPAWAWFDAAVTERRWAYGASASRLPWDGGDGPGDRASEFERLLAETGGDRLEDLFRSAGVEVADPNGRAWHSYALARAQANLPVLSAEAHRLAGRYREMLGGTTFRPLGWSGLDLTVRADGSVVVSTWDWAAGQGKTGPVGFGVAAPLDAALLRWGVLTPEELHPLVHEALFPGRAQDWRPVLHEPYAQVRVRCGGQWHVVEVIGAAVSTPHHDEAALQREALLGALGGRVSGCAGARAGFRTGGKSVPKEIRKLRQHHLARARHGDTDGVLSDLAAGTDPHFRDGHGRTLLHWLAHLDHRRVLPVLLAAGLPIAEPDVDGRTALHAAALAGNAELMTVLVAAGAPADARDARGKNADDLLAETRKRLRAAG